MMIIKLLENIMKYKWDLDRIIDKIYINGELIKNITKIA